MASNRHLGRIIALQTLYEQDFRRGAGDTAFDLDDVLRRNISRYRAMVDDTTFIEKLVAGVTKHEAALDDTLGAGGAGMAGGPDCAHGPDRPAHRPV